MQLPSYNGSGKAKNVGEVSRDSECFFPNGNCQEIGRGRAEFLEVDARVLDLLPGRGRNFSVRSSCSDQNLKRQFC